MCNITICYTVDHRLHVLYLSVTVSRPPPPVVGKVTHYSIELFWNEALDKAKEEAGGKEMVKVCLQEQDRHNSWGNVYKNT